MRKIFFLTVILIIAFAGQAFPQKDTTGELGITFGGFTNFPANKDYLNKNHSAFYLAPAYRIGKHEFTLGISIPLNTDALFQTDSTIKSRPGFIAGYRFYFADIYGQEKFFIHYNFQYLRYSRDYEVLVMPKSTEAGWTEKDMYINNIIGLGYYLYLGSKNQCGFYYVLDYVISQRSYHVKGPFLEGHTWISEFVWNNLSTGLGFYIKLF
jgi:hypothetical protein